MKSVIFLLYIYIEIFNYVLLFKKIIKINVLNQIGLFKNFNQCFKIWES